MTLRRSQIDRPTKASPLWSHAFRLGPGLSGAQAARRRLVVVSKKLCSKLCRRGRSHLQSLNSGLVENQIVLQFRPSTSPKVSKQHTSPGQSSKARAEKTEAKTIGTDPAARSLPPPPPPPCVASGLSSSPWVAARSGATSRRPWGRPRSGACVPGQ